VVGVSKRSYEGPSLDGSVQYLSEAPYWQGTGETVEVIDDAPAGEETVEDVPSPDDGVTRPDETGQTTLDDWRWSA
jgi:hypothetical protein